MRIVLIFALSGLLSSPTRIAPNNRELNKYEAKYGGSKDRRLHNVTSCKPSRGRPAQFPWYARPHQDVNPTADPGLTKGAPQGERRP